MNPFDFIKSVYHGVSQDLGNIFQPPRQLGTENSKPGQTAMGAMPPQMVSSPQGMIPYGQSLHQNYSNPQPMSRPTGIPMIHPAVLAQIMPQLQAIMSQGNPQLQPTRQNYQLQNSFPADRAQYGNDATPLTGQLQLQNPQIQQLLQYYRGGL